MQILHKGIKMRKNVATTVFVIVCLIAGGILYWQYGYVEPLQKAQYYTRVESYQLAEDIYSKMIQTSEVSRLRANNNRLLTYYNSEAGKIERLHKREEQQKERRRAERIASESTNMIASERADIVLAIWNVKIESNSSYVVCTGKITNNGKNTYKFVRVKGAFQDNTGTTVDTTSGFAVGLEGLAPNESSSFRLSVKKDSSIKSCYVSLIDYEVE